MINVLSRYKLLLSFGVFTLIFSIACHSTKPVAQPSTKAGRQALMDTSGADSANADSSKSKKTSYEEIVKKADRKATGLMNLYYKDEKLYLGVPLDLLNRNMLLSSTISKISDNQLGTIGIKPHSPLWIQFTEADSSLLLRRMHKYSFTSKKNTNIYRALQENSIGSIIDKFDIKAMNDDSTTALINVTNLFLSGRTSLSPFGIYGQNLPQGVSLKNKQFKKRRSYIGDIESFQTNVTVQSHLSYKYSLKRGKKTLAKNKPATVVMTRTFMLMPKEQMRPRLADPRVGVFHINKKNYTDLTNGTKSVHYARRFNLIPKNEQAYENGKLVEPVKPIVYYVDSDFPQSWKQPIKEAVLGWNKAFRKIGFKHAIQVRDFPKNDPGFNPANLKYNVIWYAPSTTQNAMGIPWIDPRSGQILNASVNVYHNIVKLVNNWRFVQTSAADPAVRSTKLPKQYKEDGIRYVVRHEVGHTLGFMHNMAASYGIPVDSLRSPSFTQKYGDTYSIMDYARYNYVAQPGDKARGVKLTPPELGVYDYFLVKWNYKYYPKAYSSQRVKNKLDKLVHGHAGDVKYRYGQQGQGLDPSSQTEDLGDNAVKASTYGIKNLKFEFRHLNKWVAKEDSDYTYRQQIYNAMLQQYVRYINHLYYNVGGIYVNKKKEGDPRPHYESVPRDLQRDALLKLIKHAKEIDWIDDKDVLSDWPIQKDVAPQLRKIIARRILVSPGKVKISAEKSSQDNPYKPEDVMNDIYKRFWSSTIHNRKPDKAERQLQKMYIRNVMMQSGVAKGGSALSYTYNFENTYGYSPNRLPQTFKELEVFNGNKSLFDLQENFRQNDVSNSHAASFSKPGLSFASFSLKSKSFHYLMKVKKLLQKAVRQTSDPDIKGYYELLLHQIKNAIN